MMANKHIRTGSNSYEKKKTFKYLGSLLTNQNYVHEEIKCGLEEGNLCYYSVQAICLLDSSLKIWKLRYIRIKQKHMPVVLYGCETNILREERKLRVFENKILRLIFGPRGMGMGSGESSTIRNFIVCIVHIGWLNQEY